MDRAKRSKKPADIPGSFYKRNGRWWWKVQLPGDKYPKALALKPYGVRYAITACNKQRRVEAKAAGHEPELVPYWTPYQLRHTTATKVWKEMGYECAGATLGHTNMSATAIYAERNQGPADEAARRFG